MAITYVNDLRLSEMGTGDNSGTWGTVTNTNLELIGEALGFGTEAITTNADTHTSTIADGSTDPVRAMYVKYTGALDSDCTVTIGPNTVNKLYFIENATTDSGSSGPYNLIISQGSGANITVPNSTVKAVYLDGAGSGAAVVDAFNNLSLSSFSTSTAGTSNFLAGVNAGNSITSGGNFNVLLGDEAGTAITTGDNNVAIGYEALSTEDGNGNTTAIGYRSLKTQNAGAEAYNVAVGIDAGTGLTTGISNTLIGAFSGGGATLTGASNTAVGRNTLYVNTSGANNTAIGAEALDASTTASNNTAVGHNAGGAITTGGANVAVGSNSLGANTTGVQNVAIGPSALSANTTANNNTAVGTEALTANTTGTDLTAVGYAVLDANTTGYNNVGVGGGATYQASALAGVTTGYGNTAVGTGAMASTTTQIANTSIGRLTGYSNTGGSANTYIGESAGYLCTSASYQTLLGRYNGNQGGVDVRTQDSTIALSDGSGNLKQIYWGADGNWYVLANHRPWSDNAYTSGGASNRWTVVYAVSGSINTSDENDKQNIESLTSAEMTAATAISKLFKTYKWKDKVAAEGDKARTHTGVVAQQVETAMSDAGLDASKYAFWCSDTWWETKTEIPAVAEVKEKAAEFNDEGDVVTPPVLPLPAEDAYTKTEKYDTEEEAPEGATKCTKKGIRYSELLSFISAANEQRLSNIETRLAALEAG